MSAKEPKKILGLMPEKIEGYAPQAIHNILSLETVTDEKTGISYPLYVQPFETWNEYGIRDPHNSDKNVFEMYSMKDEDDNVPWIQSWWKSNITQDAFLKAVDNFFETMETADAPLDDGRLLVVNIKKQLADANLVDSAFGQLTRPFEVSNAKALHKSYYEEVGFLPEDYEIPLTFENAYFMSIAHKDVGEIMYEQGSGVIGFSSPNTVYNTNREKFLSAVQGYCAETEAEFPPSLFRNVFEQVLYDPYQQ